MRFLIRIISALFFGMLAHAAHLAPWDTDGAEGAHAVDVGDGTYGFAGLTAETGFGIAVGVAVGLHGSDVALAGYYTMVNGLPQDTLTSQGLQAVGVPQDWANGIDVGVSVAGTMGVGAAARGTIVAYKPKFQGLAYSYRSS